MTNSINNVLQVYTQQSRVNNNKGAKKTDNTIDRKDELNISSEAKEIGQYRQILQNMPAVREEKISALQEQINSGNYNVSGEEIADKMLADGVFDKLV